MTGKPHLLFLLPHFPFSLSLTHFPLLTPKYYLFSVIAASHFFDCLSGPTVNISSIALQILNHFTASQGEKLNSHLGFSCGVFSANIIAAGPPPSAGPKTTHLSIPFFSHNLLFLFFCKICKLQVVYVYLS